MLRHTHFISSPIAFTSACMAAIESFVAAANAVMDFDPSTSMSVPALVAEAGVLTTGLILLDLGAARAGAFAVESTFDFEAGAVTEAEIAARGATEAVAFTAFAALPLALVGAGGADAESCLPLLGIDGSK